MRKTTKSPGEKIVKDMKRGTRKHYSSEAKIRIVLDGLRGKDSIAELCRREGMLLLGPFVNILCVSACVCNLEARVKVWRARCG